MPPTAVSLARMVDLALGTPEVGAVNFNVLHSLLHAVLQKLNIAEIKADLPENDETSEKVTIHDSVADHDILSERKAATAVSSHDPLDLESDSGVTGLRSASEMGMDQDRPKSSESEKKESIPVTRTPYHALEEKIERIEHRLAALSSLPSTKELMEMTTGSSDQEVNKLPRPVAEMWQSMQLSRKVDANTQGVSKLMSLVEDLMREMQLIRNTNEEIRKKLEIVSLDGNKLTRLTDKMDELEKQIREFQQRINDLPDEEFYNGFVTWSALEDSLKGLKQQYESQREATELAHPAPAKVEDAQEKTVVEAGNQTDVFSRPASRYQSRASTPGPSAQLQDLLERLGRLHEQHDALQERVEQLELEMNNKASKEELEEISSTLKSTSAISGGSVDVGNTGISTGIRDQLKNLMEELEVMQDARIKDQDSYSNVAQALQRLQLEIDRLNKASQRLCDDVNNHKSDIQRLNEKTTVLHDVKADKEFILNEINSKADKEHLDSKVNRNQFDLTCNELNQMINDLINKLLGTEGEWRNAMGQLTSEMDSKMDRLEFGPFRDELERQLRALAGKLATLQTGGTRGLTEDEAAGIRKQLVQRFHCISCDKPVDMAPQKPQASLPGQPGLPENKSMRPYLVYDLDQIRQFARSHGGLDGNVADLYATARACGGSHTMTFPHRRITRLQHVSPMFPDDPLAHHSSAEPSYLSKNNVEASSTKLPNVLPQTSKSSKSARRQQTASSQQSNPPVNGGNSRPSSARLTPRPISADVTATPRAAATQRSVTAAPGSRNGLISPLQNSGMRSPVQNVPIQLPKLAGDRQGDSNDDAARRHSGEDSLSDMYEPAPFLTEEYEDGSQAEIIPTDADQVTGENAYDNETTQQVAEVTEENTYGNENVVQ